MDNSTHEIRMANWKRIITQCQARPQEVTARQWLADNGIDEKQYYYWQRQVRHEAYQQLKEKELPAATPKAEVGATFAEINLPVTKPACDEINGFHADVVIHTDHMTIALSNHVSDSLLSRILEAAGHGY